ncbi:hypothetical protein GW17_00022189 [Ensete ventricosum]|nr:hypothetical protein GW17_00022189 [Ensete ventricosum]
MKHKHVHNRTVVILGEKLGDGCHGVLPIGAAVGAGLDGAVDDAVGGQQAENPIHPDGCQRVLGGQPSGNLLWAHCLFWASRDDDLQELEVDGHLEDHGEDGAA